jgi:hypothetical protein
VGKASFPTLCMNWKELNYSNALVVLFAMTKNSMIAIGERDD